MKVHFGKKPKYIRFEGNDIFVSFDSSYWIYCGTLDEEEKEEIKRKSKEEKCFGYTQDIASGED